MKTKSEKIEDILKYDIMSFKDINVIEYYNEFYNNKKHKDEINVRIYEYVSDILNISLHSEGSGSVDEFKFTLLFRSWNNKSMADMLNYLPNEIIDEIYYLTWVAISDNPYIQYLGGN